MSDNCSLKKKVNWIITKESINSILTNSKDGLLFQNNEYAGIINFNKCKNDKEICDKVIKDLTVNKGDTSSVETPLSVINFHTHPLPCYINAETIWGWPSGEDLKICIDFSEMGNLTHVIFAVEGTYIIDINRKLLNFLSKNKELKYYIQELFKHTHAYRMYKPDTLDKKFKELFLNPCNLKSNKNILECWLKFVNNLTINKLYKLLLTNKFDINYKLIQCPNGLINEKIYSVKLIKNKTLQWGNNKKMIFNELKKNKLNIILPKEIKYKAPFVSHKCKIN